MSFNNVIRNNFNLPFLGVTQAPKVNPKQAGKVQGVNGIQTPTAAYKAVTSSEIPVYYQPSVAGGSYGYNGPELAGGIVGKNFDISF